MCHIKFAPRIFCHIQTAIAICLFAISQNTRIDKNTKKASRYISRSYAVVHFIKEYGILIFRNLGSKSRCKNLNVSIRLRPNARVSRQGRTRRGKRKRLAHPLVSSTRCSASTPCAHARHKLKSIPSLHTCLTNYTLARATPCANHTGNILRWPNAKAKRPGPMTTAETAPVMPGEVLVAGVLPQYDGSGRPFTRRPSSA